MRTPIRRVRLLAAINSLIIASQAQGTESGCCADFDYPTGGETYNNIDTVVASWSSNYVAANLTIYCLNPGNSYSYKEWNVDSTGTFTFSHFTSDVTIEQYPSTCHLELDDLDDLTNYLLSPNFILTDIPGVAVNTFSTDPPTSTPTIAVVTTTAPGTTETVVSTASPTESGASGSIFTSAFTAAPSTFTSPLTSSLSFTPITSTRSSASTANDVAASGASGTQSASPAPASSSSNTAAVSASSSSSGLSTSAKAGIGVGCALVGLALIAGLFYLFAMKKRLRKAENRVSMYSAAVGRTESPPPVSSVAHLSQQSWAPVPQSDRDTFSNKQSVATASTPAMYTYSNQGPNTSTRMMSHNAGPSFDGPHELGADEASYGMRHHELP